MVGCTVYQGLQCIPGIDYYPRLYGMVALWVAYHEFNEKVKKGATEYIKKDEGYF